MRILYVAKHNSGDNDDEGAIAHALEVLGHEVGKVHELPKHRTGRDLSELIEAQMCLYDFCLFHKWEDIAELRSVARSIPCAFWYFDLISNDDDPTLKVRMANRRRWFGEVMKHCVTAFCTDGDWVDQWNNSPAGLTMVVPKIHWLMQGADERYVGPGTSVYDKHPEADLPEILFTGTRHHGAKRESFIREMEQVYGSRFGTVGETRQNPRRHGRQLADLFASVKVVVAPDGPCTDRYWSNRVYLTLGLGGLLLHPDCRGLQQHYRPADLLYYGDRQHLHELLDRLREDPKNEGGMRERGLRATVQSNLYRHRCEELVRIMEGYV